MSSSRSLILALGVLLLTGSAVPPAPAQDGSPAPLQVAMESQQRILNEIAAILEQEQATLSDEAVLSRLRGMLEDEKAQAEAIRALGRRTLGRSASELSEKDRGERDELAGRQEGLGDQYARLEASLRTGAGGEEGAFGRLLSVAENRRLGELMPNTATLIRENQLGRAMQSTNAIIAALEEMLTAAGARTEGEGRSAGNAPPGMMLPSLWLKGDGAELPFFAHGGDSVDTLGQILAMLRQLEEMARTQKEIADRLDAAAPADPAAMAAQEEEMRGQAGTIGERLSLLDPAMNTLLTEASTSLRVAAERLRSPGAGGAAPPAKEAAERLAAAAERLRAIWQDILARIKQFTQQTAPLVGGGSGTPHGMSPQMKKMYERLTLMMLRATGALAEDIRRETALREQTTATRPAEELPGLSGEQDAIVAHIRDEVLPFNVTLDDLPEHLHAAPVRNPVPAAELLDRAMQHMAAASGKLQASDAAAAGGAESQALAAMDEALLVMVDILQRLLGQLSPPGATPNGGAGMGMAMDPGEGTSGSAGWQVDLLPAQRESVRQAFRGNFPQRYDKAIKRYYETIAKEQQ